MAGVRCFRMSKRLHFDWWYVGLETFARVMLLISGLLLLTLKSPFVREVQETDWHLYSYLYAAGQIPAKREMFPTLDTMGYTVMVVVVVGVVMPILLRKTRKWSLRLVIEDFTLYLMGVSLALLLNWNATELIKRFYGRLRPDFLGRCRGNDRSMWPAEWGLGQTVPPIPECVYDPSVFPFDSGVWSEELTDGRMSFPSAHASFIWTGWFFPAVYIWSKLGLFSNIGALRVAIPAAFCIFPLIVTISRTSDYQHHVEDVLAGAVFGIFFAFVSCAFYFPLRLKPIAENFYRYYDSTKPGDMYIEKDGLRFIADTPTLSSERLDPVASTPASLYESSALDCEDSGVSQV